MLETGRGYPGFYVTFEMLTTHPLYPSLLTCLTDGTVQGVENEKGGSVKSVEIPYNPRFRFPEELNTKVHLTLIFRTGP